MKTALIFLFVVLPLRAFALELHCAGDVAIDGTIDLAHSTMNLTAVRTQPPQNESVQAAMKPITLSDYIDVSHYPDIQTYKGVSEITSAEFQSSVFPYPETVNIYFTDLQTTALRAGTVSKAFFVTSYDVPDFDRGAYQVDNVDCSLN